MGLANALTEAVASKVEEPGSQQSADSQESNVDVNALFSEAVAEEVTEAKGKSKGKGSVIDQMRQIVNEKQYRKIKGHTVDLFTASHVVQVYDALNPANQKKLESLPLPMMVDLVWKLVKKVS
jgi:hypothetical protein